jgi:serine/threonine-protein kinase 11
LIFFSFFCHYYVRPSLDYSHSSPQIADSELGYRPKRLKELNEYYVGCLLGKGSFGKVKEAVDKKTRKMVAIKIIKERLLIKTPGGIDSVHREIELWSTLSHPHIVQMIDQFTIESKGKIYIVMEYVDCGNLHDLVLKSPAKKLPIPQSRKFFRDLLKGIEYIHSVGIIHKDIKPANCLLSSQGILKICDFGVAERKSDIPMARRASTVIAVGSPAFQPPEIASGEEKIPDFFVDIWAVGITLFFMVSGNYPFHGTTVISLLENIAQCQWELPQDVDPLTRHLISSILTLHKEDRYDLCVCFVCMIYLWCV